MIEETFMFYKRGRENAKMGYLVDQKITHVTLYEL